MTIIAAIQWPSALIIVMNVRPYAAYIQLVLRFFYPALQEQVFLSRILNATFIGVPNITLTSYVQLLSHFLHCLNHFKITSEFAPIARFTDKFFAFFTTVLGSHLNKPFAHDLPTFYFLHTEIFNAIHFSRLKDQVADLL